MSGHYHRKILAELTRLFDRSAIENSWRGQYVELLIAEIVGTPWFIAGRDWGGHDLEHPDGTRVEVKQSAARQTWTAAGTPKTARPRFSVRLAKGYYRGADWIEEAGRRAHIYVFAWHPIESAEADHRDETQWEFYVVPAIGLPPVQSSIGLALLRTLSVACGAVDLQDRLEQARLVSGPTASAIRDAGELGSGWQPRRRGSRGPAVHGPGTVGGDRALPRGAGDGGDRGVSEPDPGRFRRRPDRAAVLDGARGGVERDAS